jgi:hypothetical protein
MGRFRFPPTDSELGEKKIHESLPDKTRTYTNMKLVVFIMPVTWQYFQLFCDINCKIAASSNLAIMKYI